MAAYRRVDDLRSCRLTACTPGSAPGPTLGIEYGKPLPLPFCWVPIEHNYAWAEAYLHTKWHLSPSNRLAITDIGRKLGGTTLGEGELSPHLTQCRLG